MRIFKKIYKNLLIGIISIILVTVGLDASDNYDNLSESVIGRLIFPERGGPCPEEMVFVPTENNGFCIDKYEASPGKDCVYLIVDNQGQTKKNIDTIDCEPRSEPDKMPWRFVSQTQAMQACAKAGKRLPSDEEWYLASFGTPDYKKQWDRDDCQVDSNWEGQPGMTGHGRRCVSSAGAYDMVGNVWEWVKGEIREGEYEGEKLPDPGFIISVDSRGIPLATEKDDTDENFNNDYLWIKQSGVRGVARGGYWDNKEEAGMYAMYFVAPPSFAGTGIGFRCAK